MSEQQHSNNNLIQTILFAVLVVGAVTLIAFLKKSSDVPLTPEGIAKRDSLHRIATPDTTETPDATPTLAPTENYPAEVDSSNIDTRIPSEAGYEDGYFTGLEDGINNQERYSYDESSQFPTAAQRRNYSAAYRRGYAQGFADGQEQQTPSETPPAETAP